MEGGAEEARGKAVSRSVPARTKEGRGTGAWEEYEGGLTGGATLSVRERKGEGCGGRRWAGGPAWLKGKG
jgi:hypothetical protein